MFLVPQFVGYISTAPAPTGVLTALPQIPWLNWEEGAGKGIKKERGITGTEGMLPIFFHSHREDEGEGKYEILDKRWSPLRYDAHKTLQLNERAGGVRRRKIRRREIYTE